jgi:hypothetical protein
MAIGDWSKIIQGLQVRKPRVKQLLPWKVFVSERLMLTPGVGQVILATIFEALFTIVLTSSGFEVAQSGDDHYTLNAAGNGRVIQLCVSSPQSAICSQVGGTVWISDGTCFSLIHIGIEAQ